VVGTLLAVLIAREMLARWYDYLGRNTLDWAVLAAGAGIAVSMVLLATIMPALRAASVQPMQALRRD
jgi:ABC-type lipoprotein release transport system permease subunit